MAQTVIEQLKASCRQHHLRTSAEGLAAESQFIFEEAFSGFEGHFPGVPILPAIMQLAALRLTVELCTEKNYILTGLKNNKFKGIVRPLDLLSISVNLQPKDQGFNGSYTMTVGEGIISTGKFELAVRG